MYGCDKISALPYQIRQETLEALPRRMASPSSRSTHSRTSYWMMTSMSWWPSERTISTTRPSMTFMTGTVASTETAESSWWMRMTWRNVVGKIDMLFNWQVTSKAKHAHPSNGNLSLMTFREETLPPTSQNQTASYPLIPRLPNPTHQPQNGWLWKWQAASSRHRSKLLKFVLKHICSVIRPTF